MGAGPEFATSRADRVASRFVLLILALGCLFFWTAIPLAGIYLGGRVGTAFATQLIIALLLVLIGMILLSAILGWLNELYLRTTGGVFLLLPDGSEVRRRGPLEGMLVGALIPIGIALVVWLLLGQPG